MPCASTTNRRGPDETPPFPGHRDLGFADPKQLERIIADQRKCGVYLSILGVGVGEGNLNDALMQRLAQTSRTT
jgi:hypothetical protein